jgi:malate dehydrogenase
MMKNSPIRITVTGAAGRVAYALLFRIACGDMLGSNQPIELVLFDLPRAMQTLRGVVMELDDCAFPLLNKIIATDDPVQAFHDTQVAILISARPRITGAERLEVLTDNAKIFAMQGSIIGQHAHLSCKVLVVGNPCNTNAFVAINAAQKYGRITARNFAALLRLDHNRALAQLAVKAGHSVSDMKRLVVWGNHSPMVYADDRFATADSNRVEDAVNDVNWQRNTFITDVDARGEAVLAARGHYAEASAANAIIDQMHDWWFGTNGEWTTMGVASDGSYGVPKGLVFGFPLTIASSGYSIVQALSIDAFSRQRIDANVSELSAELAAVNPLLTELLG